MRKLLRRIFHNAAVFVSEYMEGDMGMSDKQSKNDVSKLPNYFSVAAIVPAVLSIMCYELVDYMVNVVFRNNPDYNPVAGLGMLIPMALMMELFTFFFTKILYRRIATIIGAINQVAKGNYDVQLNSGKLRPFTEVADNFNTMTKELRSVETLRKDFINDFSHEFKTPISSINGFANLLLDTKVSEEERQQYLQIIADESERLALLSRDTLIMSKLENQQRVPDKEEYALDQQIRQAVILLSKEWTAKNIDISLDLEKVMYNGNADLMQHIWTNLLNNAIKFTPEEGKIHVSLQKNGKQIQAAFSDTGKGMTKQEMDKIFNKYYQADPSHATKGMGLGLSIAQRIVKLCNGSIEVTSMQGKGSTFLVLLPE